MNLCSNAIKFVPHDGSGVVTIRAQLMPGPPPRLASDIGDTGAGVGEIGAAATTSFSESSSDDNAYSPSNDSDNYSADGTLHPSHSGWSGAPSRLLGAFLRLPWVHRGVLMAQGARRVCLRALSVPIEWADAMLVTAEKTWSGATRRAGELIVRALYWTLRTIRLTAAAAWVLRRYPAMLSSSQHGTPASSNSGSGGSTTVLVNDVALDGSGSLLGGANTSSTTLVIAPASHPHYNVVLPLPQPLEGVPRLRKQAPVPSIAMLKGSTHGDRAQRASDSSSKAATRAYGIGRGWRRSSPGVPHVTATSPVLGGTPAGLTPSEAGESTDASSSPSSSLASAALLTGRMPPGSAQPASSSPSSASALLRVVAVPPGPSPSSQRIALHPHTTAAAASAAIQVQYATHPPRKTSGGGHSTKPLTRLSEGSIQLSTLAQTSGGGGGGLPPRHHEEALETSVSSSSVMSRPRLELASATAAAAATAPAATTTVAAAMAPNDSPQEEQQQQQQQHPAAVVVLSDPPVAVAWVRLSVEDNGSGISEADQRRLFAPFMQVSVRAW